MLPNTRFIPKYLPQLRAVNLESSQNLFSLHRCTEITDAGMDHLAQSFQKLTSLQSLSLGFFSASFFGSSKITDVGLNYLSQGLQKLTSLQSLSLHFQR